MSFPLFHHHTTTPAMRRIFPLLLYASLALAEDYPFWEVKLTSDASRRYMVGVQMASIRPAFSLDLTP